MNYADFKAHLATFLWKENDATLIANLDNLIVMANSELNRKLDVANRTANIILNLTSQASALPNDFKSPISLTREGQPGQYSYVTPEAWEADNWPTAFNGYAYTIWRDQGLNTLQVYTTASVAVPIQFNFTYRTGVPDFKTVGNSWLVDEYLDVYTYAVLSHTAPFLREDERLAMWISMKTDGIDSANIDYRRNVLAGASPLAVRPARIPPHTKRRS